MKIKIVSLLIIMLFGISISSIAKITPTEAISTTVNSVLDVMKDESLADSAKKQERRDRISSIIRDRFDFLEMARRSLARHWRKRSPEEKQEFVKIFSDLLEASYIGKIELYTNEKVTYDKETIKGGKYAIVHTTVVTKDVNIPIEYKVILKDGKWWVYDVIIEGVSFVSTYRSQYNKIIVRESYAKLIEKMKTKLDEVNAL